MNVAATKTTCGVSTALLWGDVRVLPISVVCGLILACLPLMVAPVYGANRKSLVRRGEIVIWDFQGSLRGSPKGWVVPSDYQAAFGGGSIPSAIRFGRFGLLSRNMLYTTWRPIEPLTDEVYAEGKTTVFDNHTSDLITPPFEVKLDYVTFLLSGGHMPDEACINLLVDGKVVRTATGRNDDTLEFVAFDVKAFRGKKAQIQVLDTSLAAFGYITVDCICQSPDSKGAVRVIAGLPSKANGGATRAETVSGWLTGTPAVEDGQLLIGGKAVDLSGLLLLKTGVKSAGDVTGPRLELVNGDVLKADILRIEEGKLVIRHAVFGEIHVAVSHVAQAIFSPGPLIKSKPGVLLHSNGNRIPGELLWIRDDNIAIKCSLGVIPLPRGRVRGYVFGQAAPSGAADTMVLADGSTLSGKLSLDQQNLVLANDMLGSVKLAVTNVVRVTRKIPGVARLTDLRWDVREQVGPIPPPAPYPVRDESDPAMRIFPRTIVRYALPQSGHTRRFRATLAPVADSRTAATVRIRVQDKKASYTVSPETSGVDVDFELGLAGEMEITVDCPEKVSYPCGIELHNAFIVEDRRP